MSTDISFNTTELTLKFLANKIYKDMMDQKDIVERPTSEDYTFYNERLGFMIKDMLAGKYPNNDIKREHLDYMNVLIEYMKSQDRTDLLQTEHAKQVSFSKYEDDMSVKKFDIEDVDKEMVQPVCNQPTLDDFVLTKKIHIKTPLPPEPHPKIRAINIKTESHKTKVTNNI